ncbi:MAG: serine/threonine-protein phosphatase [Lachnospiraceae bacterium]|nr:serine/threonine-protein phosphatase [Lachnospiraceae bacterium]
MSKALKGKISYCVKTDRGLCHNVNQDAVSAFCTGRVGLFVLSDGMGGHSRGELASRGIIAEFEIYWQKLSEMSYMPDFQTLSGHVRQVIANANSNIYAQYNQGQVCGATVVVLLIKDDCYAFFSVGDSHIYNYANRKCSLLTVDDIWDTLPSTLGRYSQAEIVANKSHGKLTQAVGTKEEVNIHVGTNRINGRQSFLLCSDGLYKFCDKKQIEKGLRSIRSEGGVQKTMNFLMGKVFENGAGDNVSAILVRVE